MSVNTACAAADEVTKPFPLVDIGVEMGANVGDGIAIGCVDGFVGVGMSVGLSCICGCVGFGCVGVGTVGVWEACVFASLSGFARLLVPHAASSITSSASTAMLKDRYPGFFMEILY